MSSIPEQVRYIGNEDGNEPYIPEWEDDLEDFDSADKCPLHNEPFVMGSCTYCNSED